MSKRFFGTRNFEKGGNPGPLCNWLQTASDEGLSRDVTFCRQSKGEEKGRWIDGGGGGGDGEVERGRMTGENSGARGEG